MDSVTHPLQQHLHVRQCLLASLGKYVVPRLLQVIVSPLVRLTNAVDPPLEDVGTPEGLLNSLGSYITCVTSEWDHTELHVQC